MNELKIDIDSDGEEEGLLDDVAVERCILSYVFIAENLVGIFILLGLYLWRLRLV